MATDYAVELLIDTDDQDKRTEIVAAIMQALAGFVRTTTYAATFSAGSTSINQVTLTVVAAGTVNVGVRVEWDNTALGVDETPNIVQKLINAVQGEAITIANAASRVAGDRVYNVTIVLT